MDHSKKNFKAKKDSSGIKIINQQSLPKKQLSSPKILLPIASSVTDIKTDLTQKVSPPVIRDDSCSFDSITAKVDTVASCSYSPTGIISIEKDHITGGKPPYCISIDGKKHFNQEFIFKNLPSAYYSIWIKDSRNCIFELGDFFVPVKSCAQTYIFAPEKGERWKIPNNGSQGYLRIFNLSGKIIYELQLESQETYYWNGISNEGQSLPMGVYPFKIDMTSGEKIVGNVTLVK